MKQMNVHVLPNLIETTMPNNFNTQEFLLYFTSWMKSKERKSCKKSLKIVLSNHIIYGSGIAFLRLFYVQCGIEQISSYIDLIESQTFLHREKEIQMYTIVLDLKWKTQYDHPFIFK